MDFLSQADAIRQDSNSEQRKRAKIINCPVHGHMRIPAIVLEFIDTPQFQYDLSLSFAKRRYRSRTHEMTQQEIT